MTMLVHIALFGWIPAIILIFTILPARRAVIASFLAGWCLLPVYGYEISGLPEYNKQSATCVGILLAALMFDSSKLFKFRPQLLDIPVLLWCFAPLISNTLGERGAYEGMSLTVQAIFRWWIPYFIGRMFLTDLAGMKDLAAGIFIAGLVYSLFCLYELKMSPQLHNMLYGFFQHPDFSMTRRGGGWRPMVFMQHGLAVGLFMCCSALVGLWLWRCKSMRAIAGVPIWIPAIALTGVAVLCKSTGATALMVMGLGALWVTATLKTSWPIRILLATPLAYMAARTIGEWDAKLLVDAAAMLSADRAGSLSWRLASETNCWDLVRPNSLFGFGFFKFVGLRVVEGGEAVTPDGMWLIALVENGLFGLTVFYAALLLPVMDFFRRIKPVHWGHPAVAPAVVVAMTVVLYMIDNLFNAMFNPMFVLAAGALASTAKSIPAAARSGRPAPQGANVSARPVSSPETN